MKQFLVNEFGEKLGSKIYSSQQNRLQKILSSTTGKSSNQMKTLTKTILPRIALYQILRNEFDEQKTAFDTVERYMMTVVGPKLNSRFSMFEFIPGFYYIFKKLMSFSLLKSDNWDTKMIKDDNESIEFNITKCLWYDACIENVCPEMCKIFCDVDHVIYSSMKKIKFTRSRTLATGSTYCDFCFLNKKKQM